MSHDHQDLCLVCPEEHRDKLNVWGGNEQEKKEKEKEKETRTIYLTSANPVKQEAANLLFEPFKLTKMECVVSDSEIAGGQPYGLDETKMGCINRTKQFTNNENFISIENGFVKQDETIWYDIAYIYIRIYNKHYSGWSEKREFPKELYNDTDKLIAHFETNSISRLEQLNNAVLQISK